MGRGRGSLLPYGDLRSLGNAKAVSEPSILTSEAFFSATTYPGDMLLEGIPLPDIRVKEKNGFSYLRVLEIIFVICRGPLENTDSSAAA